MIFKYELRFVVIHMAESLLFCSNFVSGIYKFKNLKKPKNLK